LWRSLERIPEAFREPLVLFYRENQSVETVAANLDLSEDAVKQRLSRGRKLLQEEVLAFVEGALKKTSPDKTFTLGVLTALSVTGTTTKAAAVGTTMAKVGAAAKIGAAFASAISFLPIIGGFYFSKKARDEAAKSPRERQDEVRSMTPERRKESLANLRRNGSKKLMYFYLSLACCTFDNVLVESRHLRNGRIHLYILFFSSAFTLFLCVQAWRSRPR
jgi:Na+/glutamate symporter